MSHPCKSTSASLPDASLGDVLKWAETNGEKYDAICELRKIPARMNMIDEDIGLIPADLVHFEHVVAPTSYGTVSKSKDPDQARKRGNARLRALLKRFQMAHGGSAAPRGRADWTALIVYVRENEGFVERGAKYTTGKSKSLTTLRARCSVGPQDLTQEELTKVYAEATSEKRKSVRKAIDTLNDLIRQQNHLPALGHLLPHVPFEIPKSPDRAERILWKNLPEAFRSDAAAVFQRTLATPEDRAAIVKNRLDAGENVEALLTEINEMIAQRRNTPKNRKTAFSGYRQGVTWLWRAAQGLPGPQDAPETVEDLLSREALEKACLDQIARSQQSLNLKDPKESQTLSNRLTNLTTVARHGLKRPDMVALIELMKIAYHEYVVTPKQMTDEADHYCRKLQINPHLVAKFVRAPRELALKAAKEIDAARAASNQAAEDRALRLYSSAALRAVQMSRPLRTSNLIRLRHRSTLDAPTNIVWIKNGQHAEITFQAGEIKNNSKVTVHVLDHDAEILWTWINVHRPRFLELRNLSDSPYVIPGQASPRLEKDVLKLPIGCVSPSTMAELWGLGEALVGLGVTPHGCRHAIATLILAVEPGNFAKAASVLGDTEDTVRKHYGRDSGSAASAEVRKSLLAEHPGIFKKMKGKLEK